MPEWSLIASCSHCGLGNDVVRILVHLDGGFRGAWRMKDEWNVSIS